jgi:hypothetical protein
MAKGNQEQKAIPGDEPGTVEETERTLVVKCPSGTTAASVEAEQDYDSDSVLMILECKYPK